MNMQVTSGSRPLSLPDQVQIDKSDNTENKAAIQKGENPKNVDVLIREVGIKNPYNDNYKVVDNAIPTLSAPTMVAGKINAEAAREVIKSSDVLLAGKDANIVERVLTHVASFFSSSLLLANFTQGSNRTGESSRSVVESLAASSASPNGQARSTAPVEGGTDITAVSAAYRHLVLNINYCVDKMIEVLTSFRSTEMQNSAKSMINAVTSTTRSGNHGIDAARQNLTGSIAGGALNMTGQFATTVVSTKAMKAESDSIKNNLGPAVSIEKQLGEHKNSVIGSSDNMVSKGVEADSGMTSVMNHSRPVTNHEATTLRNVHSQNTLKSQQIQAGTVYANTTLRTTDHIIEDSYRVASARDAKEADLARTDKDVHNETSNTQQQSGKKTEEMAAALRQMQESVQRSRNDTASAIAGRMG
ncbi:IpaC/SipC family type III secretion system effector [Pectobacterium parvum]|uniref:Uncharacterized protein n=1 Tax=Pectobacterium parvum TaxID=2778550 RepID=A0AAP9IF46_9GAMM|nr:MULTISPECIES: hypothetical protein [Pectobacterium]QHQ23261.1 hypothetical protein GMX10_03570 [Pectobacterium parvum]UFK38923.1 IpaC/SipC family type III secretion system effector [Pectobacterium parvum]UVD97044.1 IpaC/SipC family type III secretion system effector [Pectobacterium parvum]GKW40845.1 hypothetical protein PEC301879_07040 [Pectobacterium carotovorum subsp. carotovorum]